MVKKLQHGNQREGLFDESIKPLSTSPNSLNKGINYIDNANIRVILDGSCLKKEKLAFTHKQVVNIYIVYEINLWSHTQSADFTLGNSLFGAFKWTKNADPNKYYY